MRVLLTGATGLIGREVGKKLSEAGHQLTVVTRHVGQARTSLPFPARIIEWRSVHDEFPVRALEGVDAVIHLAGEPIGEGRWNEARRKNIRDSRVLGTQALVSAIAKVAQAPRVFIHGSAIGFYGDRGDEVLTELAACGTGFLSDVVRDWESAAEPVIKQGLRLVHLRTGVVFSRRGGVLAKGLGGKLGLGQQWMSWIHIEDLVAAFLFCLNHEEASGIYNGTAPGPTRNDRFTIAFARALLRPVFLPVPEAALKATLGEAASLALASQRVLPRRLEEAGFHFRYPELQGALDELCKDLQDGQHEFVAEQWVPKKPEEIFPFFSNEMNLTEITPPFLSFQVLGKSTDVIQKGTLIDYRLSLYGVPMKWRTEIETWQPDRGFVDHQLKGPYRKWHHTHEFQPLSGGTLIKDRVLYKLPLGLFGETVAGWKVNRQVRDIFAYRRMKIDQRFGVDS